MKLLDYLKKNKISQGEFARIVGVPQPSVFHWVNGTVPTLKVMPKIYLATNGEVTANDWYIDYKDKKDGTKK